MSILLAILIKRGELSLIRVNVPLKASAYFTDWYKYCTEISEISLISI